MEIPESVTKRLWRRFARMPFRNLVITVVALFFIGEQFPFSPFPMYSNFDQDASVIFVADEKGRPLPMQSLFTRSSASVKKMYRSRLSRVCRESGITSEEAEPHHRQAAAKWVLEYLQTMRNPNSYDRASEGVTGLQLRSQRIFLRDGRIESEFTTLVEIPL